MDPVSQDAPKYVQTIDRERRAVEGELQAYKQGLRELRRYLNSAKFREPGERQFLVNIEDVLLRMGEMDTAAADGYFSVFGVTR